MRKESRATPRFVCQQDAVLAAVGTLSGSLLASSSVVQTLAQCKAAEASTMEQIMETTKAIQSLQQQAQLYTPLAQRASILFKVVQQLRGALKYLSFDVSQFEALLFDVAGKERVLDHVSATKAHVLHAVRKLSISLCTQLQRKVFRRHQLLFPLLLGLQILLADGRVTPEEIRLSGQAPEPMEEMVGMCLQSEVKTKGERPDMEGRPSWINVKVLHCITSGHAKAVTCH